MHLDSNKLFPSIAIGLLSMALLAGAQTTAGSAGTQQPSTSQQPRFDPIPEVLPPPMGDRRAAPQPQTTPRTESAGQPQGQPTQQGSTSQSASPAPNQPGDTVQVPVQGQPAARTDDGVYVFKAKVEEVVLHATVVDDKQRLVTNLDKTAFTVFEDGQPQTITSFRHEDIPVALGIVIDNSGSMRDKRAAVNSAALNLVRASNPKDEVFVVNFNDEYYLDQDFTGSIPKLQDALEKIESRGGTAMYDALVASADHLKKSARLEKKVLLVVTDGEDNASRQSLEQAVRRLQAENGPTVYTVGILGGEGHAKRAKRAMQEIAEETGGVAFFPKDVSEVDSITRQVAHDIRNQYTIGYRPTRPQSEGGYRMVKVEARAKGHGKLQVRTRSGYYAGQERASR
ncbi:MAG TPA: VWA domain-containing protein [Terriglobales bacterium]|nr:VWA domain-containing protein [Terriglobales bacterium]